MMKTVSGDPALHELAAIWLRDSWRGGQGWEGGRKLSRSTRPTGRSLK